MKKTLLFLLILSCILSDAWGQTTVLPGNTLSTAIDYGSQPNSFYYEDTRNTSQYSNYLTIRAENDVFYKITLPKRTNLKISHCGSEIGDTYLHVLNEQARTMVTNDDYSGTGSCGNPKHAHILINGLAAGTYYIVSEGKNGNGNITTTIEGRIVEAGTGLTGNSLDMAIDLGTRQGLFTYSDVQDTNGFTNQYQGQPTNDVFYKFKLTERSDIVISHCGSELVDTYLHVLNASGNRIAYCDDYINTDACLDTRHPVIKIMNLGAGTYYVVSEGKSSNGIITTTIEGDYSGQIGDTRNKPFQAGVRSEAFTFTHTANTQSFSNAYSGQSASDIFYKFTLLKAMDVTISHCGSELADTFVYLLNESGTRIEFNNDYSGSGACINTRHAYLQMINLVAGTYYVVSEGFMANGSITTTIEGSPTGTVGNASKNRNYILTITPTVATGSASGLTAEQGLQTIRYFDGLGNPMQAVQAGITPAGHDLASYQEYDPFGRESKAWLPAVATENRGGYVPLTAFKPKASATYNGDTHAYSLPVYEDSPLNRVGESYGPGADWHTNSKRVTTEYLTNDASSYVCRWYRASDTRTNTELSIASGKVNYPAKELFVTKLTDEDGAISYEFKDKLGRVLLTQQMSGTTAHDTYYVYDSFGNLRAVLPPLAADAMKTATSWSETNTTVARYAYLYKYDERNRCIWKKLPGCDPVYYVYDHSNQLIFTQDGEMRDQGKWMFNIPDVFGRVVLTGTCTNSMNYAAKPLGKNVVKATRNTTATTNTYKSYTVSGVAPANPVILSVNYYDDYNFMNANGIPAATNANFKCETLAGYGTQYPGSNKGLLTGTMSAQLNQSGITTSFVYSVMYYDDRGRVIQVKSNNQLAGGIEKEYIGYNFSGQPVKRKLVHSATGKTTQTQLYEYEYDHGGRSTRVRHGLNTASAGTVIIENTYDELGRLLSQKKGALPVTTYGYNVRSWTKSIANNSLFSQTLYYNESYVSSAKRYNGNVSAMSWKVGSETLRGYKFVYDGLSRLTSASYLLNGAANSNNTVSGITYDKHGNMKTIQRRGKMTTSKYGVIDKLTMTYQGNQLTSVADTVTATIIAESNDFKKGSTATTQYTYNKNGGMSKDLNKNISDISYNLLNLPAQVTIAGVNHKYTYSADGKKLKVEQGSDSRDYAGSVIYENGSLKRILIDGGYIENGTYYYYLTDHLGNNRVVASGTGTILQKNDYYPFGMPMAETTNVQQDKQAYKFGGKEFERKNGLNLYDFEARQMDPALGRFTQVDPMAEKYYGISPYAYCLNNPMRFVDPTGMEASPYFDANAKFLGVDEKGFTGDIYITTQEAFDANSKDGVADSESLQADEATKPLSEMTLTSEAESRLYTYVLNQMKDIRVDILYNSKISIMESTVSVKFGTLARGYNNPAKMLTGAQYNTTTENGQIRVTVRKNSNKTGLSSVEAIQSNLGVHEYWAHGIQKWGSRTGDHWKCYDAQIKHPTFEKLTKTNQQELINNLYEYKQIESK